MPNYIDASMRGNSVKKTAFVLITAMVLVFAFASTALADMTNSGMEAWDPAQGDNQNHDLTPHKGYTLTTEKCLVCHAVHKANPNGEVLLADTVGNACNYCHVSTNTISTKFVYDQDPANLASDTVNGHEVAKCSSCHSIHGADTVAQAALSSSILKAGAAQAGVPSDWDMTALGSEAGAMSAFCSQCHPYFTGTYAMNGAPGNVVDPFKVAPNTFNSHIMKDISTDALYGPSNGGNTAATYDGQVAWASSNYCISCHDAGRNTINDPADSFPHMTSGARFMKSAEYVNDADVTNAATPTEDGVCLKCHVGTNGTVGVGIDF
jgi:predicted CXXCH cytochrome family protein